MADKSCLAPLGQQYLSNTLVSRKKPWRTHPKSTLRVCLQKYQIFPQEKQRNTLIIVVCLSVDSCNHILPSLKDIFICLNDILSYIAISWKRTNIKAEVSGCWSHQHLKQYSLVNCELGFHKIYSRSWCFCCDCVMSSRQFLRPIDPYSSLLLHWRWNSRAIAPMPVNSPWKIWINLTRTNPPLRWRHNGRDSFSNHQPHHCLLNRLFRRRSK